MLITTRSGQPRFLVNDVGKNGRSKHVPIPLTSLLPTRAISYRPMWLHCYLIMLLLLLLLCLQLRALGLAQRL